MIIRIAETPSELNQAYQVRMDVFVKEQHVPVELEMDEHDKEAIHFVGYVDNTPVAASRLRFVDTYGKLERICVRAEQRGQSFGKQIILRMEEQLKENGESVKLHLAQVQRLYADIDKEEFETKMKELRAAVNTLIEREEKDLIPCMNNKDYDLDSLGAEVAKLRAGESIEPVKLRKRA